jgi:hypothetical protein
MSHSWGKYAEKYVDKSKPIDTIFGGWTSMNGPDFLVNQASEPWLEFQWALKSRVVFPVIQMAWPVEFICRILWNLLDIFGDC